MTVLSRRSILAGAAAGAAASAAGVAGLTRLAGAITPGPASAFALAGARLFTFSTTTVLLRPWLKLWRTTPCSTPRPFKDRVLVAATLSLFSPVFSVVSTIPISIRFTPLQLAAVVLHHFAPTCGPGGFPISADGRQTCHGRSRETIQPRDVRKSGVRKTCLASWLPSGLHVSHLSTFMPNPIAPFTPAPRPPQSAPLVGRRRDPPP